MIRKGEETMTEKYNGYYIVRCKDAGVFAGKIVSREGDEVRMTDARRIWYWEGAASLSQLAVDGTSSPERCKFPAPVEDILLLGVIEIIRCTDKAEQSIKGVPVWTA